MDRSCRQKIDRATEILKDTIEQLDLIDICRTLHPKENKTHIQMHMEHSLGWPHIRAQTSCNKFKSIEVISSIFSHHNVMKLEINHRKRNEKK